MKLRPALLLLMLLATGLAGAQDPADPNTPTDANTPAQATANAPPARQQDDSPFDYQASEQISEDLSVSFPVDI
ncbi:hypothetical protein FV139_20290 [Parahaliea maris]|uniref:Uncharacterized protein n=1 Tax=Parahaliea maris TaxID=2716870 RepID=A0A5C8ZNW5_9GAMM|nr:hypothetical protein [Parahaliea maris]TXS89279.1 hypothetical protein FV139_20290 [Parahaliea maris]